MQDIKNLNLGELEEFLGEPKFHARQIFSWIYKKHADSFSKMSDLSQALRKKLEDDFSFASLELSKTLESCDGTKKFLFRLNDGNFIESVIIPAEERFTGCISTQAGCKFACRFCASGSAGFKRNLSCAEIIEQVLFLDKKQKLTHIVFMGTGEPLDNYDNLIKAIRIINSKESFNIGARRITVSTCGIIPGIRRLAEEGLQIELSISLHSADDRIRSQILPVNKKYPLAELAAACKDYIKKTDRQITFEYVLIRGLNADLESAKKLAKLMVSVGLCKVNLIPANPIKELKVEPPNKLEVLFFQDYLKKQGLNVTLRKSRGQDIDAACGQLRLKYEKK